MQEQGDNSMWENCHDYDPEVEKQLKVEKEQDSWSIVRSKALAGSRDALDSLLAEARREGAIAERDLWIKHADAIRSELLNGATFENVMLALSARVALEKLRGGAELEAGR